MQRPRFVALAGGLVTALAMGPMLGAVALAADPTVVVRPGDTLTGISKRHGVPVADLVQLNAISNPNRVYAGQTLRIGMAPTAQAPAAAPTAPAPVAAGAQVHVVGRGENLTTIARHYGVSVAALVAANGISNPSRIFGGQQLTIQGGAPALVPAAPALVLAAPAPTAAAQAVGPAWVHVVQRGESLTTIARHYGVTVAAIVAANGISNPSRIFGGQQLTIPGSAPAAAPAAPVAPSMPYSMAAAVSSRDAVRQVIVEEATRYGVPSPFALAVAWQESGWQQGVVSHAGAVGVMQLMPATAVWVGEGMLGTPVNINDTRDNVRAGVCLLAHYFARYAGNRDLVLAAYYQGQTAADRHGIYSVSRPYIASILYLERLFGG